MDKRNYMKQKVCYKQWIYSTYANKNFISIHWTKRAVYKRYYSLNDPNWSWSLNSIVAWTHISSNDILYKAKVWNIQYAWKKIAWLDFEKQLMTQINKDRSLKKQLAKECIWHID